MVSLKNMFLALLAVVGMFANDLQAVKIKIERHTPARQLRTQRHHLRFNQTAPNEWITVKGYTNKTGNLVTVNGYTILTAEQVKQQPQQFVNKYLKELRATVEKISKLPDEIAYNFALVMERIWQESAKTQNVNVLFDTIKASGILDDETLLLAKLIFSSEKNENRIFKFHGKGCSIDPAWIKTADGIKDEFGKFIASKLEAAAASQPATVDALAALFGDMGV